MTPFPLSVDQLKRMSWLGWFNQPGRSPKGALTGEVFHSGKADDTALITWMRFSDWGARTGNSHYDRDVTSAYRSPMTLATTHALMDADKRFLQSFPNPPYTYTALAVPIGAVRNPIADHNFDAALTGWRDGEHSDFKDHNYPSMYSWFKQFLASPLDGGAATAIPIGRE